MDSRALAWDSHSKSLHNSSLTSTSSLSPMLLWLTTSSCVLLYWFPPKNKPSTQKLPEPTLSNQQVTCTLLIWCQLNWVGICQESAFAVPTGIWVWNHFSVPTVISCAAALLSVSKRVRVMLPLKLASRLSHRFKRGVEVGVYFFAAVEG